MCIFSLKASLQLSQAPRIKLFPCLGDFPELLIGPGEGVLGKWRDSSLPAGFDLPPGTTKVPIRSWRPFPENYLSLNSTVLGTPRIHCTKPNLICPSLLQYDMIGGQPHTSSHYLLSHYPKFLTSKCLQSSQEREQFSGIVISI